MRSRIALCLVLVLCLAALADAWCIGDCNGHGTCNDGACYCNDGWTGEDCSVAYEVLHSGFEAVGSPNDRSWIYYSIEVDDAVELDFSVHQTADGDCDLYIKEGSFPTRFTYDAGDDTRATDFSLEIPFPVSGTWFAGVYGFRNCEYTISATVVTDASCPNDCSNHGDCMDTQECVCHDGYYGEDCSGVIVDLTNGDESSGHIDRREWIYYEFHATEVSEDFVPSFTVFVNQPNEREGDSDLYIGYEYIPGLNNFDFVNAWSIDAYNITIGSPTAGTYYFGLYGYAACDYSIWVTQEVEVDCDSECSGHGNCSGSSCTCFGDFEGDDCETMVPELTAGVSVTGYAAHNAWNYYHAAPLSSSNMVLSVNQLNRGGDCDMYVLGDGDVTRFDYDYRNIGFNTAFDLVIENPMGVDWHIGVYGYHECEYSITMTIDSEACPNDCSDQGTCMFGGWCQCNAGWSGPSCISPLYLGHSGELLQGELHQSQWAYYHYTAPVGVESSFTVVLVEVETVGYLELYLQRGSYPTNSDYLVENTDTTTAEHTIYYRFPASNASEQFFVGVRGNSLMPLQQSTSYKLVVYTPPI